MKKIGFFFFTFLLSSLILSAQENNDSTQSLTLSAYSDVYFANFSTPSEPNTLQPVTTVSPRNERFGLNIAQLGVHYRSEKVRGNVIIHYGDIAQATWSEEFRAVQEANMGIQLFENIWLDAGFFATHIGTESFLPKNNYTSSTAVATYNEPFFQSGARLSYEGNEAWNIALWVVSGYNYFLDANDAKSVGLATTYAFSDDLSLTYTNLFGRESPDGQEPNQFRTYHNLYANWHPLSPLLLTIGGDLGTQTHSKLDNPDESALMYNALATVRWQFNPLYSITARGEIFKDPEGFISGTYPTYEGDMLGQELYGITLSTEYRPMANAYLRLESRYLNATNNINLFAQADDKTHRWEMMITMGWEIEKAWDW